MTADPLAEVERIVAEGGDADEILRTAVDAIAGSPGVAWAGIRFLEQGELVLGPAAGEPDEGRRTAAPVDYRGEQVGELVADGDVDRALLERAAALLAEHVLLGWDTHGDAWQP
jgi:hypothetical protein